MTTEEILARFPRLSALVVGDVCLDRWCTYDPAASEASRETGIPRVGVIRTEVTAGAGGTVANNAKGTGKLFLRPDGKTIDKLNFEATSTARSKVTVDFVADKENTN